MLNLFQHLFFRHAELVSASLKYYIRIMYEKDFYVYIMSNFSKTLYIGMTNNLMRRVLEHRYKLNPGFTAKYNITKLVYFEQYTSALDAIAREKQLKNWHRDWKINLIESINEDWNDLSLEWFDEIDIKEFLISRT